MVGEQQYKNRDMVGSDSGLGRLLISVNKGKGSEEKRSFFGVHRVTRLSVGFEKPTYTTAGEDQFQIYNTEAVYVQLK